MTGHSQGVVAMETTITRKYKNKDIHYKEVKFP